MNAFRHGFARALLLAAAFTGMAGARSMDEVKVQAPLITVKQIGRTSTGIPIEELSLSTRVNTAGLDLATGAGLNEMEARIHAAAWSECAEISRHYPLAESSNASCAAAAERPALLKVRTLALRAPTLVRVREFTLVR